MATTYPIESLKAHPPYLYPGYRSTVRRAPSRPLVIIPNTLSELTGPVYGHESVREHDGEGLEQDCHGHNAYEWGAARVVHEQARDPGRKDVKRHS